MTDKTPEERAREWPIGVEDAADRFISTLTFFWPKADDEAKRVLRTRLLAHLSDFHRFGKLNGEANPSPAAVARVLREATRIAKEACLQIGTKTAADLETVRRTRSAIAKAIEAMIPESER